MTVDIIEGEFLGNVKFSEKQLKHRTAIELIRFHEHKNEAIKRFIRKGTSLQNIIRLKQEYAFHENAINFINQMILDLKYDN